MRHDGRVRTRSRPTTGVQVHREETGVKEESYSMGDLREGKAGTRGVEEPDTARIQEGDS